MCFQIFLEKGERWRAADVCRKRVPDFSSLKVERSVSSSFDVSFGTFNTLERVSEARRRSGGTESAGGVCNALRGSLWWMLKSRGGWSLHAVHESFWGIFRSRGGWSLCAVHGSFGGDVKVPRRVESVSCSWEFWWGC